MGTKCLAPITRAWREEVTRSQASILRSLQNTYVHLQKQIIMYFQFSASCSPMLYYSPILYYTTGWEDTHTQHPVCSHRPSFPWLEPTAATGASKHKHDLHEKTPPTHIWSTNKKQGQSVIITTNKMFMYCSACWNKGLLCCQKLYYKSYISVPNSSDGLIFVKRQAKDGRYFSKNTGVRLAKRWAKLKLLWFCRLFVI